MVAGHLHEVVGPDAVEADDGRVGYSFTTGTTGGAAYAIAIGTKPRRDATVSLVTYRDGRPVGVQTVSLSPLGDFTVGRYTRCPGDRGRGAVAQRPTLTRAPCSGKRSDPPANRRVVGLAEVAGFEPARGDYPQPA